MMNNYFPALNQQGVDENMTQEEFNAFQAHQAKASQEVEQVIDEALPEEEEGES